MGKILGAGLLSHSPVIMFPEAMRLEINEGQDFTLATGLKHLHQQIFAKSDYDTVIVLDSHWQTTTEFVVSAHQQRSGIFTSAEMPMALKQIPYDLSGDPQLAELICQQANKEACWAAAVDDPYLPIQYATLNLWSYLKEPGKNWLSISVCQTASSDDFLRFGAAIAQAVEQLNRRVLLIASGGLSHQFHSLSQLRNHLQADSQSILNPQARLADEQCIQWMEKGLHAEIIKAMPDFLNHEPEARFGHYLMLVGALGGLHCSLRGKRYSDYENGIGTGQVHIWFSQYP